MVIRPGVGFWGINLERLDLLGEINLESCWSHVGFSLETGAMFRFCWGGGCNLETNARYWPVSLLEFKLRSGSLRWSLNPKIWPIKGMATGTACEWDSSPSYI